MHVFVDDVAVATGYDGVDPAEHVGRGLDVEAVGGEEEAGAEGEERFVDRVPDGADDVGCQPAGVGRRRGRGVCRRSRRRGCCRRRR